MLAKKRKFEKSPERKTAFLLILLFVGVGFLAVSNLRIYKKKSELNSKISALREEIRKLERKNQELKAGVSESLSETFIEKKARESLNLKKEGEEVAVILPPSEKEKEKEENKGFWRTMLEKIGL